MPGKQRGSRDPDLERGMPRRTVTGLNPQVAEPCPTPGCGEMAAGGIAELAGLPTPRVPDGWIYVQVRSSAVPGRWFCSASCAHVGLAIAQLRLRVAPTPPK